MVPTTATLDLSIWRNDDVYEYALRVIGPNLTGVSLRAQIRSERDVPGPARIALETVTNGNAEGVRLASATFVDGRWVNDVRLRINKSTRQALPYFGDFGDAAVLRWALAIGGRTRIDGRVFVLAHAMDSDNAPLDRTASFGLAGAQGGAPSAGATLTIAADSVAELVIDGADLVERSAAQATDAAAIAILKSSDAGAQAANAALYAGTALASMGGLMFKTVDAGIADARKPLFFTVPGDDAATASILYERGGELTFDFTGGTMPAGATLTRAAGPWSRVKPDGLMEIGSAANVARFDYDPVTKALRGLLVEPSRTNLALRSQEFNATDAWVANATTVTANVAAAPDGTMTADRVTYQSPSQARQEQGIGANANPATVSVYSLAQPGSTKFRFVGNLNVEFTPTASWSRSSVAFVLSSGGGNASIYNASAGGTNSVAFWGYQVEAGAQASSYIPTTTAAATRAADVLTLDWGSKGGPQTGNITVRYTFDDASTQDVQVALTAGKATVDPTVLNRYCIRGARLLLADGAVAIERKRFPSAGAPVLAAKVSLQRTSAAIVRSLDDWLKDGGFNVRDFGAKGDGITNDTAALKAAADEAYGAETANVKVPVLLPRGVYPTDQTLRIRSGLIGMGMSTSVIKAASASAFVADQPIVRVAWTPAERDEPCTVALRDFRILGAGSRTAERKGDPATMGFAGNGLLYDEEAFGIHATGVQVSLCRKGIVHGNLFGHLGGTNVIVDNCWFNLWWELATGDFRYYDSIFTGALFATYGCHGSLRRAVVSPGGINGLLLSGCHGGFAPYLFYQEDGNGGQGLNGITMINSSAEQVGNRLIRLGGRTTSQRRVSTGWDILNIAHTWTDPAQDNIAYNSYTIKGDAAHPIQDYAIQELDLVQGHSLTFRGDGLKAGKSGYAAKVTDALAFIRDETGLEKWQITGQGAERLVYTAKAGHEDRVSVQNLPLSSSTGTTEVASFQVPVAFENVPRASISFGSIDINNKTGSAQTVQLRVSVNAAAEQVLAKIYAPAGISKQAVDVDFALGKRDRINNKHVVSVRLSHGSGPINASLNDDGLSGQIIFKVGQTNGTA
jgi:hypothetical protein